MSPVNHIAANTQLDLFLRPPASEADKVAHLSTCPWLEGKFANKLWRHSLHAISSYPSKLRPQIASFFIDYLSKPSSTVLDPMAGSGTIPLQACLAGGKGIGIDLSPYAFLLIRVKVQPPPLSSILQRIDELESNLLPLRRTVAPREVKEFFHGRTLRELLTIRSQLRHENQTDSAILALLCGILHGGRPGFLSRRTRDIIPIRPAGSFEYRAVIPRLRAKAHRAYANRIPSGFAPGQAHLGDSLNPETMAPCSADLILTSPPFFEHTEFVRHNWLRLWLVGWELKEQRARASNFVGEKAANLPRFGMQMEQLVSNFAGWLKPRGYCVIHGGKKNTGQDMSQIIIAASRKQNLSLVTVIDERMDHSRKHALRKISGESHNFVVLRRPS